MRRNVLARRRLTTWGARARAVVVVAVLGAAVLALSVGSASGTTGPGTAFDFGANYKALVSPVTTPTEPDWFTSPTFDETGWAGESAPFGFNEAYCHFPAASSDFPLGSTIYLRKSFALPGNAFGLHLAGTIDNFADVYVNGHHEGPSPITSGSCAVGAIHLDVPNSEITHGGDNLVAVKARDDTYTTSYFDMKATYGSVDVTSQPTETLRLSTISPAPAVTITDADGHPVVGQNVSLSLETVAHGPGTLSGTLMQTTDGSGVATFPGISVAEPGKYRLVATADGATVKSDEFAVDDLKFDQQPTETEKGSTIAPSPTATIHDPDGHGIQGKTVTLSLTTLSGSGALSGNPTATTDSSGVATFDSLSVTQPGQYRLVATSDNATVTSDAFLIADQITPCTGSCSATGSTSDTTFKASTSSNGGSLAVSVIGDVGVPAGVCGNGFTPLGAGSYVNLLGSSGNLRVTWTLDRSLVRQAGNPIALRFDICLGAENLSQPDGTGVTPWRTKFFRPATAVDDPNLGATLFWGLLPNCLLVKWQHGVPTGPCVIDKRKNLRGDVIIDFFLPYPWDASMHGG
jgi:hypothetical protein